MNKCQMCGRSSVKSEVLPISGRQVSYVNMFRKKTVESKGWEISEEKRVCPFCFQANEDTPIKIKKSDKEVVCDLSHIKEKLKYDREDDDEYSE